MSLKKALKKSIAVLTVMTLFAGLLPSASFAAEGDGGLDPAKPTIYIDYLGSATGSSLPDRGPLDSPQSYPGFKSEGIVFWVGVRLSHLDQVQFLQEGGLHDLELAFDYNPEYVVPADSLDEDSCSSSYDSVDETAWAEIIKKFNFSSADNTSEVNAERWSSDDYSLAGYSISASDPDTADGREYSAPAGWKAEFISILKNADTPVDTNRFYGVDDTDDHYILKVPFLLKAVPADGAKPLVFRLALGPSSLVMTSGADGETAYSWEKEDRTEPELNLKNIFQFDKDLNIFKDAEGVDELSMLRVVYTEDDTQKNGTLYSDEAQTAPSPYTPEKTDYYMSVPLGTASVSLVMSGMDSEPTVEHSDRATPANVTAITGLTHNSISNEWTAVVPLDGAAGESDYKDIAIITVGENVYHIYIKKAASETPGEARIELAPGNSPYGLIERMGEKYYTGDGEAWSEEKIQAAKEAFNKGNQFVAGYVPDGGTQNQEFSPNAWCGEYLDGKEEEITDSSINMDRNTTAQILFNGTMFTDAGFAAYDSAGNRVDDTLVTRTVTVKKMNDVSINTAMNDDRVTEETLVLSNMASDAASNAFQEVGAIRPGVYDMKYSFEDLRTGKTIEIIRKIVILWELGDSDLSMVVNSTDADTINHQLGGRMNIYDGVEEDVVNLYRFRIMDSDCSAVINSTDADRINHVLGGRLPAMVFYRNF